MMGTDNQTDQAMLQLLNRYLDRTVAGLPPEDVMAARYRFSPGFDKRMQPLFRKARKLDARWLRERQPHGKLRARLAMIAIILAILASLAAVTVAREQIWEFIVTTFEKFSSITFNQQNDPDPSIRLGEEHLTLPGGYQLADRQTITDGYIVIYENSAKDQIVFVRSPIYSTPLVDSENAIVEEINIRGQIGMFISKKGYQTIIWQEYLDAYMISGYLSKEELLGMLP